MGVVGHTLKSPLGTAQHLERSQSPEPRPPLSYGLPRFRHIIGNALLPYQQLRGAAPVLMQHVKRYHPVSQHK